MSDNLDSYLVISGVLFAIGTFGFLARRNAISMLMSIELMLNAVNLTIVAFGSFIPGMKANPAIGSATMSGMSWSIGVSIPAATAASRRTRRRAACAGCGRWR